MKTFIAAASLFALLVASNASFAGEVSELLPTDPRAIKICSCKEKGPNANCEPLQGDRSSSESNQGRH